MASRAAFAVVLLAVCLPLLVSGQLSTSAPAPAGQGRRGQTTLNGSLPLNGTLPDCEGDFNGTMFKGTMPPVNGTGPRGMGRKGGPGSPMGAPFGAPRGAPHNSTGFNGTRNGTFPCRPRNRTPMNQTATLTPTPTPSASS